MIDQAGYHDFPILLIRDTTVCIIMRCEYQLKNDKLSHSNESKSQELRSTKFGIEVCSFIFQPKRTSHKKMNRSF